MKKKIFSIIILTAFFFFLNYNSAMAELGPRIPEGSGWSCWPATGEDLVWECSGICQHCGVVEFGGIEHVDETCIFGQGGRPPCRIGWLNNNPECACCGNCQLNDMLWMGVNIADIILRYLGIAALVIFVVGGIMWMTSGGVPDRVAKGKKIVQGAVIGILIVLFAHFVVSYILEELGAEEYLPSENQTSGFWPILFLSCFPAFRLKSKKQNFDKNFYE